MKARAVACAALVWMPACHAAPPPPAAPPTAPPTAPRSEDDKALYALGALLGKNVRDLHLSEAEMEQVKAGLGDEGLGRPPQVDLGVYGAEAQQLGNRRRNAAVAASAAQQRAKDQPFEDAAAREPNAQSLPGGAILKPLTAGQGDHPAATDRVRISYQATLADGTVFDSTDRHGGEARVALNEVLPCLKVGLENMTVAETAQLVCPPSLGYGDPGRPPKVPGGATLVFKVSLLEINPKLAPPGPVQRPKPEPEEHHRSG